MRMHEPLILDTQINFPHANKQATHQKRRPRRLSSANARSRLIACDQSCRESRKPFSGYYLKSRYEASIQRANVDMDENGRVDLLACFVSCRASI